MSILAAIVFVFIGLFVIGWVLRLVLGAAIIVLSVWIDIKDKLFPPGPFH